MKISSCQGILMHHGGCCLRQHTKVAVRPHIVLDTQDNPPPKATLSVYSWEHCPRRLIHSWPYTILFINNPNWIIKCANISLCPWSFNHSKFCLIFFSLIQISALNLKCRHYKALFTLRVVLVRRAKLFRAVIKGWLTQPNMQGETTHPPELSDPRDRFAIFMWMVG